MKSWLAAFLVLGCLHQGVLAFRVICVYTNWSQYRPGIGKFLPEDVDPTLCTHIIYVYAKLQGNTLVASEWNDESSWSEGMFDRVNNLKKDKPGLKTLLGVGGWMMGSKGFSRMAARGSSRRKFAESAVKYLRERDFDGLAIDWQYPTRRGGKRYDRKNFSLLLKEIRREIEADSRRSSLPGLLLSVGVSASKDIIDSAYEMDNLTRYTDFINVLAYDLHGSWDNYTGHPSQLYPRNDEFGPSTDVNVDAVMRYWISKVPDRSKLNLGVSTYGRSFTLRKERHNEYNVPTKGPGLAGEHTKQPGMLAYYERCSQYPNAKRVWDDVSKVAYWHSGDQWMAGEDVESIKAKIRWMKTHKIGGMTIWSLDTDDFYDTCMKGLYPLLNAINDEILAPFVPPTTTPSTLPPEELYTTTTESFRTTNGASSLSAATRPDTSISTTRISKPPTLSKSTPAKVLEKKTTKQRHKTDTIIKEEHVKSKKKQKTGVVVKPDNKSENTNKQDSNTNQLSKKPASGPKRSKQFKSRNENPKPATGVSKPIREGNRIVVRRKKVVAKGKNSQKSAAKQTPTTKQQDIDAANKEQQLPKSTTGKSNAQSGSNGSKSNDVVAKPKAEPLKSSDTTSIKQEIKENTATRKPSNSGKKDKENGVTDNKKNNKSNNKRKGRKVVRKIKRRKLTKKQIEMLKKRRRMQQKRRQKNKSNQSKKIP